MIPTLVPRNQLLAANGIFTLTLNAAFALGFALLGPLVVKIAGPQALIILVVAALYFVAAVFCFDAAAVAAAAAGEPTARGRLGVGEAEKRRRVDLRPAARGPRRTSGPTARSAGR